MNEELLPYDIILAASTGDLAALRAVLRHYEGYIARLSTRNLFDEYGNAYLCTDEAMRCRLEAKLMAGVLSFRAA